MSPFQLQILFVSLAVVVGTCFLVFSVAAIRYQITARHLRVTWLGVPVRWIRLEDIRHIGTRPVAWAERWPNVLFQTGRTLVIRRRRGLCKNLLITPPYPFEFKATLEQARENLVKEKEKAAARGAPGPEGDVPPSGHKQKNAA